MGKVTFSMHGRYVLVTNRYNSRVLADSMKLQIPCALVSYKQRGKNCMEEYSCAFCGRMSNLINKCDSCNGTLDIVQEASQYVSQPV